MAAENKKNDEYPSYSQFACIGAGFSAIGLGATLKRWYNITDIRFFERHLELGGTWHANQYPGCACDIPSALYSFSFEPNPDWSRALPPREELWAYLKQVADKYDLPGKMTFGVNVERCEWIEERSVWRLHIRDRKSDGLVIHESQFLFTACGILVQPREIDIPGVETFKGPIFHSARWRHDVDLTGKKVVLFGNGCTASQIVPSIVGQTAHLTQVVRTKHWVFPPSVDTTSARFMKLMLKYVPGVMLLQRFIIFAVSEDSFRGFSMTKAAKKYRQRKREVVERYMRSKAPEKYHDLLIPDFEIGCKRRIFDCGYLESLHAENLTLTDEPVLEVLPEGVRTKHGIIDADAIVLANGFVTGDNFFGGTEIVGRAGETPSKHWERFGGAEAYNCSVMSGFPNFFALLGPNSATGHTSTIIAAENSINYALRIIRPILDGRARAADLKPEAEQAYVDRIQADLQKTVFASGCHSWYLQEREGGKKWNSATYPWTQAYFWYRSLFPVWKDWQYSGQGDSKRHKKLTKGYLAVCLILFSVLGSALYARRTGRDFGRYIAAFRAAVGRIFAR